MGGCVGSPRNGSSRNGESSDGQGTMSIDFSMCMARLSSLFIFSNLNSRFDFKILPVADFCLKVLSKYLKRICQTTSNRLTV